MTRVWSLSADRQFNISGDLRRRVSPLVPPVTTGSAIVTRFRGRSNYTAPPAGFTWPPPDATWAALPDQPAVNYVDFYTAGDDMRGVLTKIQAFCTARGTGYDGYREVVLPNGFDEQFSDFSMASSSKLGLFFNRILGFIGDGEDNCRFGIKPMSSTVGTQGTMVRLAGQLVGGVPTALPVYPGTGVALKPISYGFTMYGSPQPDQVYSQGGQTGPQLFGGWMHYGQVGAIMQRVRFLGASCGNWNSPPGETFSINSYKTKDCIWRGVEVDGRDPYGNRYGGSPFGGNNSDGDTLEDFWGHHSKVSGQTWSFAGDDDVLASISKNVSTLRMRQEHNANIPPGGSGQGFGPINNENVGGTIYHDHPYLSLDNYLAPNQWAWNAGHIAINCKLFDNPDITINEPEWTTVHPRWSGMLVISSGAMYGNPSMPQAQTTAPTVIKNGSPMTPLIWTQGSGGTPPVLDPLTNYVWMRG